MNIVDSIVDSDNTIDLIYNVTENLGIRQMKKAFAFIELANITMSDLFEHNALPRDYFLKKFSHLLKYEIVKVVNKHDKKKEKELFIRLPLISESLIKLGILKVKDIREVYDVYEEALIELVHKKFPDIAFSIGQELPFNMIINRKGKKVHCLTNDFSYDFILYYNDIFDIDFLKEVEDLYFEKIKNK